MARAFGQGPEQSKERSARGSWNQNAYPSRSRDYPGWQFNNRAFVRNNQPRFGQNRQINHVQFEDWEAELEDRDSMSVWHELKQNQDHLQLVCFPVTTAAIDNH